MVIDKRDLFTFSAIGSIHNNNEKDDLRIDGRDPGRIFLGFDMNARCASERGGRGRGEALWVDNGGIRSAISDYIQLFECKQMQK